MKFFSNTNTERQDRQPAVAGQFYPGDSVSLTKSISDLYEKAKPAINDEEVLAVVSPHAGYVFSGEVAATSFNQIDRSKKYDNIFVIGSSHRTYFDGASIYNKGFYEMPMGEVKVNTQLASELIDKHRCFTYRSDAHNTEHSLEVQLPFLQYIVENDFQIVPIVIATQTSKRVKEIADALKPYFNANNLFVISTDMSHYPDYQHAKQVDQRTAEAVATNNPEKFLQILQENEGMDISNLATSMCGWTSVLSLMYMTEGNEDYHYHLIDYKNSGDSPYGDHDRVVGYYALSVTRERAQKKNESAIDFNLSEEDKDFLLKTARETIEKQVNNKKIPKISAKNLSEELKSNVGIFVTLRKKDKLRGCIGRFNPDIPLYQLVQEVSISSATRDYRFSPVKPEELKNISIEISVLSPLQKIESVDEIELGKHGIYIKSNGRSGTFLPHVATETGWNLEEFLGHCARDKAGIGWEGWKEAEIYIYEAIVFHEKE